MSKIKHIKAREILASNGCPSIEVTLVLDNGSIGEASVAYGASSGKDEAFVLLDNNPNRYAGFGMLKAVEHINEILTPKIINRTYNDPIQLDKRLIQIDGTKNKYRLGANAILGVSMAFTKACAKQARLPLYKYLRKIYDIRIQEWILPNPMMVAIEGGKHADNTTDLQEYCISIIQKLSAKEAIRMGQEIYIELATILKKDGLSTNVGHEGAFAPSGIKSNKLPLEYINRAIINSKHVPLEQAGISIDAAASVFYRNSKYHLKLENKSYSSSQLIDYYKKMIGDFPVISLEDMLSEDDWNNWTILKKTFRNSLIITDDITATNPKILQNAIDTSIGNGIIIKLNQIGTISETIECCKLANRNNWVTILSHRGGGETNDTIMVDIAVAVGAAFIKVGPTRGERVEKYNRLLRIEEELDFKTHTYGRNFPK